MLLQKVKHGNAPIAELWSSKGEVDFLEYVDPKNKDRCASWLHDYPKGQMIPAMNSSGTMLDIIGATAKDQTHNIDGATEVIKALTAAKLPARR